MSEGIAALPPCRACEALRNCLPELLRDNTFAECMRVSPPLPFPPLRLEAGDGRGWVWSGVRMTPQPGAGCSSWCIMSAPHHSDPPCQVYSKTPSDTWQVDAIDGLHRYHFSITQATAYVQTRCYLLSQNIDGVNVPIERIKEMV